MNLKIQVFSLIFSLIFGVLFGALVNLNYKLIFNKNIKINDIVKVRSREETKKVKVKEIKYLYEDELTLPLEKMSKIL